MKKNIKNIVIAVILIGIVGFGIYALTRPDTSSKADTSSSEIPKVEADKSKLVNGNSLGNENAKVTISEFGDYQCPACAQFNKILNQDVLPKYGDKVRLVFLNYPLPIHKNAKLAAQAAEASALQGKFWQMHDLLYDRQEDWERENNPNKKFEGYAKEIGLNLDQFKNDLDSQKVKDIIIQQMALGNAFNVPGTPTFFVNGELIETSKGAESLNQAIDKILAQ